ncbi:MAG: DUF309 domain-containing protein [Bacilli bacterium]
MSFNQEVFSTYVNLFHAERDYFECHEVLEEHWKSIGEKKSSPWVFFISFAVANYHWRRSNFRGALKSFTFSKQLFQETKSQLALFPVNLITLEQLVEECLDKVKKSEPYEQTFLPLTQHTLQTAPEKNYTADEYAYLCNKHTLRNRTDVIQERTRALHEKMKKTY